MSEFDERTDGDLVRAYRKGDERSFEVLVLRYLGSMYRFAFRFVHDARLAEDIVQETFVKAWTHLFRYDAEKPFKAWIYAIARNTSLDAIRRKDPVTFSAMEREDAADEGSAPEIDIADPRPLPDEVAIRAEMAEEISVALAELPPKQRSVVLLHDSENLTFREIAEASLESLNTVKSRYRRAVERLKNRLNKEENEKNMEREIANDAPNDSVGRI